MPSKVTYANRHGDKIEDTLTSYDWASDNDTDDKTYEPSDSDTVDYQSSLEGFKSSGEESGSDTDRDDDGSDGYQGQPGDGLDQSGNRVNVDCQDRPEEPPIIDVAPDHGRAPTGNRSMESPQT